MITVSQDEYIRMINLLKYQAEFILSNVKVEEIQKDKEESKEFLRMLNDLDLTFADYLWNLLNDLTIKRRNHFQILKL